MKITYHVSHHPNHSRVQNGHRRLFLEQYLISIRRLQEKRWTIKMKLNPSRKQRVTNNETQLVNIWLLVTVV
jgi:hypothetical protein